MSSTKPIPVGQTCPDIDKVIRRVRQLHWRVKHPEHGGEDKLLAEAVELLEVLRASNSQLRKNAATYEEEAKRAVRKFHQVLAQVASPARLQA